ncbi:hypothetical protein, partial [Paenibacillus sp. XY044]|uniref:hypothetical protein n=1 Tax=Paenibacillus sp. XY044 TaxID=2026089 RepID=UPI001C52BC95
MWLFTMICGLWGSFCVFVDDFLAIFKAKTLSVYNYDEEIPKTVEAVDEKSPLSTGAGNKKTTVDVYQQWSFAWQRPTLPGPFGPSTIGAGGLNGRVR